MSTGARSRTSAVVVLVLVWAAAGAPTAGAWAGARPAAAAASVADATPGDEDVDGWLELAGRAQTDLAWSGTQLVSTWADGRTDSVLQDVVHVPGEGLTTRAHGASSGSTAQRFGADDVTTPDEPTGTSYLAEAADQRAAPIALLHEHFAVALERSGEVAGRSALALVLSRDARPRARLWLDRTTGLLLRREVYDEAGRTERAMAFLDVEVSPAAAGAAPADGARAGDWASWSPSATGVQAVRRAGWRCPDRIGTDLVLYDARTVATGGAASIMHLSYSDGLSSLSVFQQRGRLDPGMLGGYVTRDVGGAPVRVRQGLQTQAVWQSGDSVVTVVADDPDQPLGPLLAAMPSTPLRAGWMTRTAHRVLDAARWLTPLR